MGVDKTAVMEDGSVFVVTSASIDYLMPARLDDCIEARATVVASGAAKIEFEQAVVREGVELARGRVSVALTEGTSGRPKRMPATLRAALKASENKGEVNHDG
jgi:acyl-CoA thioesterase FadM